MEKNVMKKQIKNKACTQYVPRALFLKYTYSLIARVIIALALSPVHIKTACDHKYQEAIPVSYTIQTSAAHKLCEAVMMNDKALALEAIHDLNGINAIGYSALIQASSNGCTDIVNLLLKLNADVHIQNKYNETALTVAARKGHTEIVHLLLEHNANIDSQNNEGHTALTLAAQKSKSAITEALILHGADINAAHKQRKKTLKMASPEIQKTIARATAKRQTFVLELGQQNWDLRISPRHIVEDFMTRALASIVCDYADPYHTTEQPLYSAMQRYIQSNMKRSRIPAYPSAQKSTPTSADALYHTATPHYHRSAMHKPELHNTCAIL